MSIRPGLFATLLGSDETDAVVVVSTLGGSDRFLGTPGELEAAPAVSGKPVVVYAYTDPTPENRRLLSAARVPWYPQQPTAAQVLSRLLRRRANDGRRDRCRRPARRHRRGMPRRPGQRRQPSSALSGRAEARERSVEAGTCPPSTSADAARNRRADRQGSQSRRNTVTLIR